MPKPSTIVFVKVTCVPRATVVLLTRWRVLGTPGTGGVGPEGPEPTRGVKGRKAPKGTQTGQQPRFARLFQWYGGHRKRVCRQGLPRVHPTVVTDIMEWDCRAAYRRGIST